MEPKVDSSYVAAVYEHTVIQTGDPRIPVSRSDALRNMQKNLDIYEVQAAKATKQEPFLTPSETQRQLVRQKSAQSWACSVPLSSAEEVPAEALQQNPHHIQQP
ncbi:hypothetical protein JOQ06_015638 [Pogonophryne albipinna]|uniref:Uncharacterized protein n=1 Tax=Pogonophryne albipinna TaxID=1090488 RepID=A0AAD6FAT8_9TELE|nr:hypothetical protein JOQ06_015638 [Pogonophryne albipinna]